MRMLDLGRYSGFIAIKKAIYRLQVLGILLLAAPALASTGQPIQPLDIFELKYVSSTQISADGEWVAYLVSQSDIREDRYQRELWITDYAGKEARLVSDASQSPGRGIWSPDGRFLAFTANTRGTSQIHLYDRTTGLVEQVSSLDGYPSKLTWSPDGKKVAFTQFVPKERQAISPGPVAPKGAKWAAEPIEVTEQYYRWDRAGYRKPGSVQLFVFDVQKRTAKRVSKGNFDHGGPYSLASMPSWTPDSKSIVMSLLRDEERKNDFEIITHIYRYNVRSGKVKQLTDFDGVEKSAVVSPNGKQIAYIGYDNKPGAYYHHDVYVMPANGGKPVNLTDSFDKTVGSVRWADDNQSLYVEYEERGEKVIAELSLSGEVSPLVKGLGTAGDYLPYLSSLGFSIARDGRFAVSSSTNTRPSEAMVGRKGQDDLRKISAVSDSFTDKVAFNGAEEFNVKSKHGEHQIQGWLIKPPGFDPKKSYPLIIDMHGGPYGAYSAQFSFKPQLMAAKGYLVAYTNPRGSTGYGKAFLESIDYKFPEPDGEDILDVADYLADQRYVDKDNLFISGGSGGGLLGAWLTTKTHRFNAAAILFPVINWETVLTTGDKPIKFSRAFFKTDPWKDPQSYRERSPITYVNKVKTPTIILTGEQDYRTPISQSEEYFGALKLMGVDAALIRFPGQGHGIGRIPSHSMRTPLYIVDWFDRYRKNK